MNLSHKSCMDQIPTLDQLSHQRPFDSMQPGNRTNITAVTTQPLYIEEDCHPSPKSWSIASRTAILSIWLSYFLITLRCQTQLMMIRLQLLNANNRISLNSWTGFSALVLLLQYPVPSLNVLQISYHSVFESDH